MWSVLDGGDLQVQVAFLSLRVRSDAYVRYVVTDDRRGAVFSGSEENVGAALQSAQKAMRGLLEGSPTHRDRADALLKEVVPSLCPLTAKTEHVRIASSKRLTA